GPAQKPLGVFPQSEVSGHHQGTQGSGDCRNGRRQIPLRASPHRPGPPAGPGRGRRFGRGLDVQGVRDRREFRLLARSRHRELGGSGGSLRRLWLPALGGTRAAGSGFPAGPDGGRRGNAPRKKDGGGRKAVTPAYQVASRPLITHLRSMPTEAPLSVYRNRLAAFAAETATARKSFDALSNARLALFLVTLGGLLWFAFRDAALPALAVLAAGTAAFAALVIRHAKVQARQRLSSRMAAINNAGIKRMEGSWGTFPEDGREFYDDK